MESGAATAVLLIGVGVLGLAVGSFLNVVIARVPDGRSVVHPRSQCPGCGTPIAARDNIPVVSWLLLRGRCRACDEPISPRYPLIELLNAVLWLLACWWAATPDGVDALLPLVLVLISAGIALAAIDLDHHRLPAAIVYPLYPVTVAGLALDGVVSGAWPIGAALAGAAAWLVVIGGIWLLTGGRGMGFGDVTLAPVLGAVLGWVGFGAALVGLFAAFVLGAIVGLVLVLRRSAGRRSRLAFGPFLLVGAGVGLVLGPDLASGYASWVTG